MDYYKKDYSQNAYVLTWDDGEDSTVDWYISLGFWEMFNYESYAQSNGGVSNADIANMTHGYITGAAAVSAQSVAEQGFKYGQRINGRAVSTRQLTNYADDVVKGTKLLGKVSAGVSVGFAVYDFANSDMSGGDIAELTGSVVITATAFIPIVGPVICIGLSMADAYGAFDSIYEYFEPTPQREEWKF